MQHQDLENPPNRLLPRTLSGLNLIRKGFRLKRIERSCGLTAWISQIKIELREMRVLFNHEIHTRLGQLGVALVFLLGTSPLEAQLPASHPKISGPPKSTSDAVTHEIA